MPSRSIEDSGDHEEISQDFSKSPTFEIHSIKCSENENLINFVEMQEQKTTHQTPWKRGHMDSQSGLKIILSPDYSK